MLPGFDSRTVLDLCRVVVCDPPPVGLTIVKARGACSAGAFARIAC